MLLLYTPSSKGSDTSMISGFPIFRPSFALICVLKYAILPYLMRNTNIGEFLMIDKESPLQLIFLLFISDLE